MNDLTSLLSLLQGSQCSDAVQRVHVNHKKWDHAARKLCASIVPNTLEPGGEFVDMFRLLRAIRSLRDEVDLSGMVGAERLDAAEQYAAADSTSRIRSFDDDIRRYCKDRGVTVSGRFPTYTLNRTLRLSVDPDAGTSRLGRREIDSADARTVWSSVQIAIDSQRTKSLDVAVFLDLCEQAYSRLTRSGGENSPIAIPIREVFKQLASTQSASRPQSLGRSKMSAYTQSRFRENLGNVIATGHFVSSSGRRLELLPTAFPRDGIAIMTEDGVRYFGRMSFTSVET